MDLVLTFSFFLPFREVICVHKNAVVYFPNHFKTGRGGGNKQESLSSIILGAEFCFNILRLYFFIEGLRFTPVIRFISNSLHMS